MSVIKEFKEFAMRGNVIDLAVGVVIGGAFGKIVASLVADVIMPPIGLLIGGVNFTDLKWEMKAKEVVDGVEQAADVPAYFNNFNYNEQIHAGYFTYGNKFFDKLSVQGGLRGEYMIRSSDYTYKDANDNWSEKTQPVHYDPTFRLFPSAFISYSLPKNNELQLNYTSRVNRPRGRQITLS